MYADIEMIIYYYFFVFVGNKAFSSKKGIRRAVVSFWQKNVHNTG